MDYDFRTRSGQSYDAQLPMYRTATSSASSAPSSHPMYRPSLYPRVGQPGPDVAPYAPNRPSPHHHHQTSTTTSASSSGLGIRVTIKPQYRITPPPQLSPQLGDIPRSNFQFDFEVERKILAEAEKDNQNWSRLGLENLPSRTMGSASPTGPVADPVVSKYISSGLSREAVPLAVANYGDNPTKVREFVNGYTLLREMGFSSNSVAEALVMYENDTDKALAHFLNSPS
ncbi:uncharacterized protein LOC133858012 isoform X2 [Alnus glutinosa]|uniref:uncharacterized protein LOC133858012 isoform X2 n=1 Tax=Alnus glutinosa TaxID=3517 RepID=UPI002D7A02DD|nr:uncharacterized protein LOC133858012 isoform X2 [Alnus glutinosa]